MYAFRLVIYKSDSEGGHANVAFVYIRRIAFATWTSKSELRMRNSHVKLVETWHKTIIQYILQLNVWICTFVQHTQKMVALQHCSFFSPSLFFFSLARTHFCSTNRNFSLASPTIKHWESIFVYGNNGRVRWLCEGALKRNKERGLQWTHFSSLSHCTFHPDSISKRASMKKKKKHIHTYTARTETLLFTFYRRKGSMREPLFFKLYIFFFVCRWCCCLPCSIVCYSAIFFPSLPLFQSHSLLCYTCSPCSCSLCALLCYCLFVVCVCVCIRFVSRM